MPRFQAPLPLGERHARHLTRTFFAEEKRQQSTTAYTAYTKDLKKNITRNKMIRKEATEMMQKRNEIEVATQEKKCVRNVEREGEVAFKPHQFIIFLAYLISDSISTRSAVHCFSCYNLACM